MLFNFLILLCYVGKDIGGNMKICRLGTRGSKLAVAQVEIVKAKLEKANPNTKFEIEIIHTQGDIDLTSPLCEIGGKGVFIKELEVALLNKQIDIAVHSLKDITTALPIELQLSAFLPAEAFTDVLILNSKYKHFDDLPLGAILATGSMRRKALLKKIRPDIKTIDIRGNVLTRIEKLNEGSFDGVLLSEAGLIRLQLEHLISYRFNPHLFCPAPGQGVIALESRKDNPDSLKICRSINDRNQEIKSTTELAFLEKVDFDCRAPLGLHAILEKGNLSMITFMATEAMDQYMEQRVELRLDHHLEDSMKLADDFISWREKYDSQ